MFTPYEIKVKISGGLIYLKSILIEGKTVSEYDPPILLQVTTDVAVIDVHAPPNPASQTSDPTGSSDPPVPR